MPENNNSSSAGLGLGIVGLIVIIGFFVLVIAFFSGAFGVSEKDRNCAVREQDKTLKLYYYDRGITPTSEDLKTTYQQALQVCK